MDSYTSFLIDGLKSQQYNLTMKDPDYVFEFKSSHCGDRSKFYVKVDNKEIIVDASYEHLGCTFNCLIFEKMCATSVGKPLKDLLKIRDENFDLGIEVPLSKQHCFSLAIDTISKGLNK